MGNEMACCKCLPESQACDVIVPPKKEPDVPLATKWSQDVESCIVCMDSPKTMSVRFPCGHADMCMRCTKEWLRRSLTCPICRCPVLRLQKRVRL